MTHPYDRMLSEDRSLFPGEFSVVITKITESKHGHPTKHPKGVVRGESVEDLIDIAAKYGKVLHNGQPIVNTYLHYRNRVSSLTFMVERAQGESWWVQFQPTRHPSLSVSGVKKAPWQKKRRYRKGQNRTNE